MPHAAPIPVLIASWLDQEHVDRIIAAEPDRIEVLYAPELMPKPQFQGDRHGPRPTLADAELNRWRGLVKRAVVSYDIDWDRPTELLTCAPELQWIQASSSGVGPRLQRIGLMGSRMHVTNAAGLHAQSLAEFVLMSTLYFAKEMDRVTVWKAERHWQRFCAQELPGTRMLLIGLGAVGARIAAVCAGLGIEVIGHRRRPSAGHPAGVTRLVDAAGVDAELPHVDWLVIAAPETAETRNIIDRRRLGLLPQRAVVINVGRGALLDEDALIERLAAGQLRGASLDVFRTEPLPADSPLWSMPNVIVVAHSASTVGQEDDRLVDLFIENLHRFLDGRPMINVFDHSRAY